MTRITSGTRSGLAAVLAGLAVTAAACGGAADDGAGTADIHDIAEGDQVPTSPEDNVDDAPDPEESPTAPSPATTPPPTNAPSAGGTNQVTSEDEGVWHALIVTAEAGSITLDKVEILSGAEAEAARAEDGEPDPGADVPYIRNRNDRLRTIPVASDVAVEVFDCSGACELVPWAYTDLVDGTPLPYGSPETPFTVTVRDGKVEKIVEVYLP
jgi:hypothetical protein